MVDPRLNGGLSGGESAPIASPLSHLDAAIEQMDAVLDADEHGAPPQRGLGTGLRRLTGVDEDILARVPSERPRYTKLGIVILGTALVAAFSMWLALTEILGAVALVGLLPALAWGLFIGNLDSWLVSSMHGSRWRNRIWMMLPRLLLAILFGVLIAEPFVLRIFEPAIVKEIKDGRNADILKLQTRLRNCNPASGVEPSALIIQRNGGCTDARVNVHLATPTALETQLDQLKDRRSVIQGDIEKINRRQQGLDDIARRECNGTRGNGLTGRIGVGPNCVRNRAEADLFRQTSRVGTKTQQFVNLNRMIASVERQLKDRAQRYENAVSDAIATKVAERRANQEEIGLLERLGALATLAGQHWHIAVAAILLRLMFITIDCLPLLVKIMGGTTSYDRLLDDRLASTERIFREEARANELRRTAPLQIVQHRVEREHQAARETLDRGARLRRAGQDVELDAHIDRLTEQLLDRG
jgi:hypothetical protein